MKVSKKNLRDVKTVAVVALLTFCLVFHPSCSLFVGSTQPVTISTTDPQAQIYVDGQLVGTGIATVSLRRNRAHGIIARVGDRAGSAHIGTKISTTGILDIVGGFLFLLPFIGLVGPGFWSLDQEYVSIALPPGNSPLLHPPQLWRLSGRCSVDDRGCTLRGDAKLGRRPQLHRRP